MAAPSWWRGTPCCHSGLKDSSRNVLGPVYLRRTRGRGSSSCLPACRAEEARSGAVQSLPFHTRAGESPSAYQESRIRRGVRPPSEHPPRALTKRPGVLRGGSGPCPECSGCAECAYCALSAYGSAWRAYRFYSSPTLGAPSSASPCRVWVRLPALHLSSTYRSAPIHSTSRREDTETFVPQVTPKGADTEEGESNTFGELASVKPPAPVEQPKPLSTSSAQVRA